MSYVGKRFSLEIEDSFAVSRNVQDKARRFTDLDRLGRAVGVAYASGSKASRSESPFIF